MVMEPGGPTPIAPGGKVGIVLAGRNGPAAALVEAGNQLRP